MMCACVCACVCSQGLGLYAARDIEKCTMVIEYIGTIIRSEVANRKERLYESQVISSLMPDSGLVVMETVICNNEIDVFVMSRVCAGLCRTEVCTCSGSIMTT